MVRPISVLQSFDGEASMRIGILGSGTVGKTLGEALARLGHTICLGTRRPVDLANWQESVGIDVAVSGVENAAVGADLIILATSGTAVETVIEAAGLRNFKGKVVLDVTDPLDFSSGKPGLFVGTTDSLGERIQRLIPEAQVVKAFNTVAALVMVNPSLTGGEPDFLIAGNDETAKERVIELARGLGWRSIVDLGGIENARWLEALSLLWVVYNHNTGSWLHAFQILRKANPESERGLQ